jgi:hypothetical protein
MDPDDGHLGALSVGVLVECEKARLASFDEVNESRHAAALRLVGARLSRFVAMKMNGPDMRRPLSLE